MDIIDKISKLQKQVILWSVLYYSYDYSEVSDFRYNEVAEKLMELQHGESLEVCKQTRFWYVMSDFDCSTGYYLHANLTASDKEMFETLAKNVLYHQGLLDS